MYEFKIFVRIIKLHLFDLRSYFYGKIMQQPQEKGKPWERGFPLYPHSHVLSKLTGNQIIQHKRRQTSNQEIGFDKNVKKFI